MSENKIESMEASISRLSDALTKATTAMEAMNTEEKLLDPLHQAAAIAGIYEFCGDAQRVMTNLAISVAALAHAGGQQAIINGPGLEFPK